MTKGRRWQYYDIYSGKCSGFPDCCIRWFIDEWIHRAWKPADNADFIQKYNDSANQLAHELGKKHIGYIICPKCIESKNLVKMNTCKKDKCTCHKLLDLLCKERDENL